MSLDDRMASSPQNLPHHGGKSKPHVYTVHQGDQMRILFGILLADFDASGFLARVAPVKSTGRIPRSCTDPGRFHNTYSVVFREICKGPFEDLPECEQHAKLSEFLFKKFSTDPAEKKMAPAAGKKRKLLSWPGFHITDIELPQLVHRVIAAYRDGSYRLGPAGSDQI
jgi:hypothetical protein